MSVVLPSLLNFFSRQNLRSYSKGHVICSQGDMFSSVYMIKSGMVKIYDLDATGSERTITVFAKNNIFPVIWLLERPPPFHQYYYEAFSETKCFVAPLEDTKKFIHDRSDLLLDVTDMLTKAYINFEGRVQNLERSHIHERLEFVLFLLATRLGSIDAGIAVINEPITQEDIARLAGVTRESMSLEMNRAQSKGLIWKRNRRTYINLSLIDTQAMPHMYSV